MPKSRKQTNKSSRNTGGLRGPLGSVSTLRKEKTANDDILTAHISGQDDWFYKKDQIHNPYKAGILRWAWDMGWRLADELSRLKD